MIFQFTKFKRQIVSCGTTLVAITGLAASALMAAPFGPPGGAAYWVCHLAAVKGSPAVTNLLNGMPVTPSSEARDPINELAYLKIRFDGSAITGTLYHVADESCVLSIDGGELALDTNGVGTLTLRVPSLPGATEQGDLACSALLGGQTSLTETFHAVSASSNQQIDLAGDENYVPPGGTGMGTALVPVAGACVRQ